MEEELSYSLDFQASFAMTSHIMCDSSDREGAEYGWFWVGPSNAYNAYFVVDVGCEFMASKVELRNVVKRKYGNA